ncbi:MAG: GNAT family N-acetyltransferase [Pseudomonadota bacterium]
MILRDEASPNEKGHAVFAPVKEEPIKYFFKRPDHIPSGILDQIQNLIKEGEAVGTAWVTENLERAYLIGYAIHKGQVIGSITHKYPKEEYRKKIEAATGLDLSGYLERGYTIVRPEYQRQGIGDAILKGLVQRSKGKKIYVTIRMDNIPPLRLTYKNDMVLAAKFSNPITGHEIGVFTNQDISK